jgi:hypothetical protein
MLGGLSLCLLAVHSVVPVLVQGLEVLQQLCSLLVHQCVHPVELAEGHRLVPVQVVGLEQQLQSLRLVLPPELFAGEGLDPLEAALGLLLQLLEVDAFPEGLDGFLPAPHGLA